MSGVSVVVAVDGCGRSRLGSGGSRVDVVTVGVGQRCDGCVSSVMGVSVV